ncbi:hypothetical protein [Streptomyces violascens]|uniref:hypothetical protein n=1 Tax=Streptomyces violascens TaxID=67381 RepID=UPI0036818BB0
MLRALARGTAVTAAALALSGAFTANGASALHHHSTPERLNTTAYYGSFDILARQTNGLNAKFTKVDGTPVAGLPVRFTVAGEKARAAPVAQEGPGNVDAAPRQMLWTPPKAPSPRPAATCSASRSARPDWRSRRRPKDAHVPASRNVLLG